MKVFTAVLAFSCYIATGSAQGINPKAQAMMERYYRCFDASTKSQFVANIGAEANLVAERAFQACATEEETIFNYLTLSFVPPNRAREIILEHRSKLKRRISG